MNDPSVVQSMVKPDYPQIEIEDLTAVIRESIAQQNRNDKVAAEVVSTENKLTGPPELKLQPDFQPRSNNRYHINDLLRYHDRAFVQNAYRAILKRPADATELSRALRSLHSGPLNKIDLLASLRFSAEGKAKHVKLDGLTFPALVRRMGRAPVIGYFIRLAIALIRLPNLVRSQREFEGYALAQNQQITDFTNGVSARVVEYSHGISRIEEELSKQFDLLGILNQELQAIRSHQKLLEHDVNTRFSKLDQKMAAHKTQAAAQAAAQAKQIDSQKELLLLQMESEAARRQEAITQSKLEQQRLLDSATSALRAEIERVYLQLQQARAELALQHRNMTEARQPLLKQQVPTETHDLDALYAALEDRFRGSHEEIKERFRVYLPYVKGTTALQSASLIDLGSGRGEWLELLYESGIKAYGVEKNRVAIERCRERQLEVVEADVMQHLRGVASESTGAVTGFHIIEHLSLETLVNLLDEAVRVLRPGGALIFETPNPENVIVGSNFFYLDPTHRHPLPSQLMEFLLESRGFHRIKVVNLHPWDAGRVSGEGELTERFNGFFYGPMDYAILGWKVEP